MHRPRLFEPGFSHHVIHRGNNRGDVFRDDLDRRHYLSTLRKLSIRRHVAIHGYALMKNHVHLLVTAFEDVSIPRMMRDLGPTYVRYFNDRHARTGTLWEGRYRASLIADERYWLTCLRYIELNPVRAGIVESPGDYEWSSHRAHVGTASSLLLSPHPLHLQLGADAAERGAHWSEICGHPLPESELAEIRHRTQRCLIVGEPPDADGPRRVA